MSRHSESDSVPGITTKMTTETGIDAPYYQLDPARVMQAVEAIGYQCDGRLLALNSYENRVYRVGLTGAEAVVVKFYRPNRWTNAAILEEHTFLQELADHELAVVAPLADAQGETLHEQCGYRFSLFPLRPGRPPELERPDELEQLGRLLARLHNVGQLMPFRQRPDISVQSFGIDASEYLLAHDFIPASLRVAYETLAQDLITEVSSCFTAAGDCTILRLHGDCHAGNILWAKNGPLLVDLDDARNGPAVQDLWMFLAGDRQAMTGQLADLLEGYTTFREFDARELHLVEALRTLRMMHYAAWLARRWRDPAFPQAFPWFNTASYWDDHVLSLREQLALMQEPPLVWD